MTIINLKSPRYFTVILIVFAFIVSLFLIIPSLYVIIWSFLGTANVGVLGKPTVVWYKEVLFNKQWIYAATYSVSLAIASSTISTISSVFYYYSSIWFRNHYQNLGWILMIGPLFFPTIIYGLALRATFNANNLSEWSALLVGHSVLSFPIQYFIIESNNERLNSKWIFSAVSLGATHWEVLKKIVFPLFHYPILLAFGIGFLLSFDEIVLATFVIDSPISTIPKKMWDAINYSHDPTPAVIGTSVLLIAILCFLLGKLIFRNKDNGY